LFRVKTWDETYSGEAFVKDASLSFTGYSTFYPLVQTAEARAVSHDK
jgi:hypothetical protein